MNGKYKIFFSVVVFIALATGGYLLLYPAMFPASETPVSPPSAGGEYRNETYGFSVALPETWRGYSVTIDTWTGYAAGDELGDVAFTAGPGVSIHNPNRFRINGIKRLNINGLRVRLKLSSYGRRGAY